MKITIRGPVEDVTGYAAATRELALALFRLGADVKLQPVPWGVTRAELPGPTRNLLDSIIASRGCFDGLLNISIPPLFCRVSTLPAVGLTMLEVDGLPASWVDCCNRMDEVWVPSSFNAETFCRSGVIADKIRVMPLGVDTGLFTPVGRNLAFTKLDAEIFIFLSVFEWVPRKGYDLLLTAYLQEFTAGDDVCLVLKSHSNSDYDPDGTAIAKTIHEIAAQHRKPGRRAPEIALLPEVMPMVQMPELYRMADCFVLPTRGEGWNLPALEALACGLPVITTAWSAHLDWLNNDNAFLIEVESLDAVPSLGTNNDDVYRGHHWARPSIEHLRYLMRWVYEHRSEARERAAGARAAIETELSWDASAGRMYRRLQELLPVRHCPVPSGCGHVSPGECEAASRGVAMIIPSLGKQCGIAEYTKTLCRALKRLGWRVKILGGPLTGLNPADLLEMPIVHFQYEYSLYDNSQLESLCRLLATQGKLALLTLHSYKEEAVLHNQLLRRLFTRVIVHAEHTRELLQKKGWPQELRVIPMGIPDVYPHRQDRAGQEIGPGSRPAIGFFGFMHWHKGILPLAQAVKRLRSTCYPNAKCYLFSSISENRSSGEFCSYFLQQIETLGLQDAIELSLDFIPEQELIDHLSAMDINVLPYTECGYNSTSAAVRMLIAARRPIITSDASFFADLDAQVMKISAVTPEAICDALCQMLGHPQSQEDRIGRIEQYALEHTWEKCAEKHHQLYLDLLQGSEPAGARRQVPCDEKDGGPRKLDIGEAPHPENGVGKDANVPTVSALYVVKNEEEYLPFSIKSVYDAVQEIVVVDNGSTDRTVTGISGLSKVKLYSSDETDFSSLRNFALSKIASDWVLIVDADEVFYDDLKERLPELVRDRTVDAYTCWFYHLMRSYYYMQNRSDNDPVFKRLFLIRNVPGLHYEGVVHEKPVIGPKIKDSGIHYVHYGYTKPPAQILDKFKLYDHLLGRSISSYDQMDPDDLLKCRPLWPFRREHPQTIRSYIEQKAALLAARGHKLYKKPPEEPDEDQYEPVSY